MGLRSFSVANFCLVLAISASNSFALGTDGVSTGRSKKNKVFALVKIENQKLKCIKYADHVSVNNRSELPLCAADGDEGAQIKSVMTLAENGGNQRTAFLTHIAAAIGGCAAATAATLLADLGLEHTETTDIEKNRFFEMTNIMSSISLGAAFLANFVASDPSGHTFAIVAGAFVCGHATSFVMFEKAKENVTEHEIIRSQFYSFSKSVLNFENDVLESWRNPSLTSEHAKSVLLSYSRQAVNLKEQAMILRDSTKGILLSKYSGTLDTHYDFLINERIPSVSNKIDAMLKNLEQEPTR